jgi:predicted phosphodiesterase
VRYLILADIHANLQALDAVLKDAAAQGYDQVLVLGDLVGYGADPAAAIDRTLALEPAAIVRGNHDKVCARVELAPDFNEAALQAAEWTTSVLSPGHLAQLAALPKGPARVTETIEICHGTPFDEDYYVFDLLDAQRALESASARLCLFGHTHVPAAFASSDHPIRTGESELHLVLPDGPALVNVGSVGQPRDGDPRAAYGLLDVERNLLEIRRVPYDIAEAQVRIRRAGLPERLASRLSRGQ